MQNVPLQLKIFYLYGFFKVEEITDIKRFKSRDEACRNEEDEAWKLWVQNYYYLLLCY